MEPQKKLHNWSEQCRLPDNEKIIGLRHVINVFLSDDVCTKIELCTFFQRTEKQRRFRESKKPHKNTKYYYENN